MMTNNEEEDGEEEEGDEGDDDDSRPPPNRCDPSWAPNKNGGSASNCDQATNAQRLNTASITLVFVAFLVIGHSLLAGWSWVSE
jgi:hypothetical protein